MRLFKISETEWRNGLDALREDHQLIGPVNHNKEVEYEVLSEAQYPELTYSNTRSSAKSVVFPQNQIMFNFTLDENAPDHHVMKPVHESGKPRVVIGVRPCDAAGFQLVKKNFNDPSYPDPYWLNAYDNMTLVGLACDTPCSTCFCDSVGGGPYNESGLDVICANDDGNLLVKPLSEKGDQLVNNLGWKSEGDPERFEQKSLEASDRINSKMDTSRLKQLKATDFFNAPFWDTTAFACLNCGICTYTCPTCWCFDIQDEVSGLKGTRSRNWDSCQYPLFTLEGSGHNPRPVKTQRVRQRFMHKLKYYLDKYDSGIQCVGCGRCIQHCPVNIDIREVCATMNDYHPQAVEPVTE